MEVELFYGVEVVLIIKVVHVIGGVCSIRAVYSVEVVHIIKVVHVIGGIWLFIMWMLWKLAQFKDYPGSM